jgi:hypothetical protein
MKLNKVICLKRLIFVRPNDEVVDI